MSMDFWRPRKESKPDPSTNREWLESLTDKELAEFLTCGLFVHDRRMYEGDVPVKRDCVASLNMVSLRYTQSHEGVRQWLGSEQEFEVIKEENEDANGRKGENRWID